MFGSHLSIAGGLVNALREADSLRMDTVQVFTKNQRQWRGPALDPGARDEWRAEAARLGWQDRTVAHNSYLINLASPDASRAGILDRSLAAMRDEIERCEALGIPMLVGHPGAYLVRDHPRGLEAAAEEGMARIARAFARLLHETRGYSVVSCLENTAGGGTTLGRTFEELARTRALILEEAGPDADLPGRPGDRIGFCLDTCHALAAGYDLASHEGGDGTGRRRTHAQGETLAHRMLEDFGRVCGIENLRVVHLNDSKGARGSRIDRHEHIGRGRVAPGAFAGVLNHPHVRAIPKILETPKEPDARGTPMDTVNLRALRRLSRRGPSHTGG